jgi:RNA polymerase primary sigma factor
MRQLKITKSITNRESQSLDKYLQDIGKEELITAEEEVELARRIKQGDQLALEKLTRANLTLRGFCSKTVSKSRTYTSRFD